MWSSCNHLLQQRWGVLCPPQTEPTHRSACASPFSAVAGGLGTQYRYMWHIQAKFSPAELPYVSTGTSHRRGHTLGMTKWAEENWLHTNAYQVKIPQFRYFLPYVVMLRGFINKSCSNRGLNLKRVRLISAPHCFLTDCSVSACVGIMWRSACPQSCLSRCSLGWEVVRARINISR